MPVRLAGRYLAGTPTPFEGAAHTTFGKYNIVKHAVGGEAGVATLIDIAKQNDHEQVEYIQALEEVLEDLVPVFDRDQTQISVMRHLMEPERIIKFRVPWVDDNGHSRVNRGYRVQYNSALGPYKGGLRFHPSVNESILKFLGFEQIFKNSLTTLALGGGKGGANFDPKGKSLAEIMRFCQSFMTELAQYIGPVRDVPAGDIGVGGTEIGYMFGQYKRMTGNWEGVLTGKAAGWGGSNIRPEATGYGCVYFANEALKNTGRNFEGASAVVSGSGNVAQFTAEKLLHLGAKPITFSDSSGYIVLPKGFTQDHVDALKKLKADRNARVSALCQMDKDIQFVEKKTPWEVKCDMAFPSATQNELDAEDAKALVSNGCKGVFEGANMPTTPEAISIVMRAGLLYGPGKAANAGGVAVSGLEMAQNAQMASWSREEVDERLQGIMRSIYLNASNAAEEYGKPGNLKVGANIAGFLRVSAATLDHGQ